VVPVEGDLRVDVASDIEATLCRNRRSRELRLGQLAGSKVMGRCSKPRKKGLGRRVGLPSTFRF
jgi:hypothetical protein